MSTLSERLKLAMKGPPKVVQSDLAAACKVTAPSVNDWLSGKTKNIVGETLFLAAEYLNVDPRWLAGGKGNMRPDESKQASNKHDEHAKIMELLGFDPTALSVNQLKLVRTSSKVSDDKVEIAEKITKTLIDKRTIKKRSNEKDS